jgi:hypothetical protein
MAADTCPKCGWVVDYGCGCPHGSTTFPLVEVMPAEREIIRLRHEARQHLAAAMRCNRDARELALLLKSGALKAEAVTASA